MSYTFIGYPPRAKREAITSGLAALGGVLFQVIAAGGAWTLEEREAHFRERLEQTWRPSDRDLLFALVCCLNECGLPATPERAALYLTQALYRRMYRQLRVSAGPPDLANLPDPEALGEGAIALRNPNFSCIVSGAYEHSWLTYLDPISGEGIVIVLPELP
jgi:hypothetical protein